MSQHPLLIVVLAAGKGLRMRSALPKILHPIGGQSMLGHVLATARQAGAAHITLVMAPGMNDVRAHAASLVPDIQMFEQSQPLGTAHAVLAARPALEHHRGDVLVVFADTPLLEVATIARLRAALQAGADVAVLGFAAADATGYGRVILDATGSVTAIREHMDAAAEERCIPLCNAGAMAFRVGDLAGLLARVGNANAKGEYYLTDAVEIARADGLTIRPVICDAHEAMGVNSRQQLAAAEAAFQHRARLKAMEGGATLIAPETVWLSFDTRIGRDVTIEPNVFLGTGVLIEDGAQILAHCHLVGARVCRGARVGPFARLRPGAVIGGHAHVGNFVEVKNATLEEGAKANHLAYIGDGRVGEGANIGAGTIFCNYDGFAKHFTEVGKHAFIGSNTSLVAPVKIGDGAYIASGSVITRSVEPDALAIARSAQEQRTGWAAKFRALMKNRRKPAVQTAEKPRNTD
jgi:bifunctional UDP-N-acetylglucosamine pyrophosphorylase / glucosamine-1-phosphate N-acetyltransferase